MGVILARRRLVLGLLLVAGVAAQQKDRLAGPIDGRRTFALAGSRRPGLQPQSDQGRVDPSFRISQITLAFKLSDSQQADLQRLLANQQDRSSPDYHHWLSPTEYADRFGLSPNDVAQVEAWLQSGGFRIDYVPPSRNFLVFSGTAQQVQAAFATEIHSITTSQGPSRLGSRLAATGLLLAFAGALAVQDQATCPNPLTQGFWKNHTSVLQVETVIILPIRIILPRGHQPSRPPSRILIPSVRWIPASCGENPARHNLATKSLERIRQGM